MPSVHSVSCDLIQRTLFFLALESLSHVSFQHPAQYLPGSRRGLGAVQEVVLWADHRPGGALLNSRAHTPAGGLGLFLRLCSIPWRRGRMGRQWCRRWPVLLWLWRTSPLVRWVPKLLPELWPFVPYWGWLRLELFQLQWSFSVEMIQTPESQLSRWWEEHQTWNETVLLWNHASSTSSCVIQCGLHNGSQVQCLYLYSPYCVGYSGLYSQTGKETQHLFTGQWATYLSYVVFPHFVQWSFNVANTDLTLHMWKQHKDT